MADVALIVIVVVVIAATTAVLLQRAQAQRLQTSLWRIQELPGFTSSTIRVCCVRGEQTIAIGEPVDVNSNDFESEIELRRSEARSKLVALNGASMGGQG